MGGNTNDADKRQRVKAVSAQKALGQIRSFLPGDSRQHLASQISAWTPSRVAHNSQNVFRSPKSSATPICFTSSEQGARLRWGTDDSGCRACGSPNTLYYCTYYSQVTSGTVRRDTTTMPSQMCVCCSTSVPYPQESYTNHYTRNAPSTSPFKSDSDSSGSGIIDDLLRNLHLEDGALRRLRSVPILLVIAVSV